MVCRSLNERLGTGNWDMTGGSDPWYMKRVVDYIIANNAHLVVDADRFYPSVESTHVPTLLVVHGHRRHGTRTLPQHPEDAVWWSMLALPAVYGALTVFPIASMAKDHLARALACSLLGSSPSCPLTSRTPHGHWLTTTRLSCCSSVGFMYWLRAVKYAGSSRISKTTSPHPLSFVRASRTSPLTAKPPWPTLPWPVWLRHVAWVERVRRRSVHPLLGLRLQVALNMFRRRDSTSLSVMFLVMLTTTFLMALPFYAHPQLNLVLDSTGLQPFLFIFGFTIAIAFVTTGFRDKPWLLVLGTLGGVAAVFFVLLYVLKTLNLSDAWDVLFTGSGYFTKTKIFGTVAEANAPNRAQLFASFGPITFLLALIMGGGLLWRVFDTATAPPWCSVCGSLLHVHGLERCSFHVQRHACHGHPWRRRYRCLLAVGQLERTGSLVEEVRYSYPCDRISGARRPYGARRNSLRFSS